MRKQNAQNLQAKDCRHDAVATARPARWSRNAAAAADRAATAGLLGLHVVVHDDGDRDLRGAVACGHVGDHLTITRPDKGWQYRVMLSAPENWADTHWQGSRGVCGRAGNVAPLPHQSEHAGPCTAAHIAGTFTRACSASVRLRWGCSSSFVCCACVRTATTATSASASTAICTLRGTLTAAHTRRSAAHSRRCCGAFLDPAVELFHFPLPPADGSPPTHELDDAVDFHDPIESSPARPGLTRMELENTSPPCTVVHPSPAAAAATAAAAASRRAAAAEMRREASAAAAGSSDLATKLGSASAGSIFLGLRSVKKVGGYDWV